MSDVTPSLLRSVSGFSVEVGQKERLVVLRMGRVSGPARGPGRHRLIPGLERGIVVDMSKRTLEGPPIAMDTADRATLAVGVHLRWQVIDPLNVAVLAGPLEQALLSVAATGARAILAETPLDQVTARWRQTNDRLAADLGPILRQWGVALVEIDLREATSSLSTPGTWGQPTWPNAKMPRPGEGYPVVSWGPGVAPEPTLRARLVSLATIIALVITLGLTTGLIYPAQFLPVATPLGAASNIPPTGSVHKIYLLPLDGIPKSEIDNLALFFGGRYGIDIEVWAPIPGATRDPIRRQVSGLADLEVMRALYPDITPDSGSILIGITDQSLYSSEIPSWRFEYGERYPPLGIISNANMTAFPILGDSRAQSRLRKMLGRYIGVMYYGLGPSSDQKSLLYRSVLGSDDLDNMGEEF